MAELSLCSTGELESLAVDIARRWQELAGTVPLEWLALEHLADRGVMFDRSRRDDAETFDRLVDQALDVIRASGTPA